MLGVASRRPASPLMVTAELDGEGVAAPARSSPALIGRAAAVGVRAGQGQRPRADLDQAQGRGAGLLADRAVEGRVAAAAHRENDASSCCCW